MKGARHNMEIRKADAKGRIVAGKAGMAYSVIRGAGGVVELFPISIPVVPSLGGEGAMPGVYVSAARYPLDSSTVTIVASLGTLADIAELCTSLASSFGVPVVCDAAGVSAGVGDIITGNHPEVEVIFRNRFSSEGERQPDEDELDA